MPSKLTAATFLQAVRHSGLVDDDQLQVLESEWRNQPEFAPDAQAWANELVERELLTQWQAGKLLQGKHRGFILGNYRLLALLGKGGMSSVYLAEHRLMRRRCALKVLPTQHVNSSSYLGRFHREAQAVASLDHPNIVRAYDVSHQKEQDAEIHFLVMEYVAGQSLHELVASCGPVSAEDTADYLRQAADGLEHAHRAGIVHRDVKPGNLLVDGTGTVKILDLGLARFFHEAFDDRLTLEHDERILGTADFLAPEQALDSHTSDHRADVYSLGCTGYFLLTGHPPFTEGTLTQRLMAHQNKIPRPLSEECPDIPESMIEIIERMMAKRQVDRFQTAGEVAEVLTEWLREHASQDWRGRHGDPHDPADHNADYALGPALHKRRKIADSQPTLIVSNSDTDPMPVDVFPTLNLDAPASSAVTIVVGEDSGIGTSAATPLPRRSRRRQGRRKVLLPLMVVGAVLAGLAILAASRDGGRDAVPEQRDLQNASRRDGSEVAPGTIGGEAALKWSMRVGQDGDFPTIEAALAYVSEHRERFETEAERRSRIRVEIAPGMQIRQPIVIDNSAKRVYPDGLQLVCPGSPAATVESNGTHPAVEVRHVSNFLLEGLRIRGNGTETAVSLAGHLNGCRFRGLTIDGFTRHGIRSAAASGALRAELVLENITCRSEADKSVGIAFQSGESATARVRIQRCRLLGQGSTGLQFSGDASYVSILQNIIAGSGPTSGDEQTGIRFEGDAITLRNIVVGNNTFYALDRGIVMDSLPSGSSNELGFYRNLFATMAGPELSITQNYDLNAFVRMLSTVGSGVRQNWSDRAPAKGLENGEHDLVIPPEGERVNDFAFQSTDAADEGYLKPTPAARFVVADPSGGSDLLQPFIGAVAP